MSAVFLEICIWGRHAWQGPWKQWCGVQDSHQSVPRLVLTLSLWAGRLHSFPTAELLCFPFVFNSFMWEDSLRCPTMHSFLH